MENTNSIDSPATKVPRADWQMPPKPESKEICDCGGEIIAEGFIKSDDEGQGWHLVWACSECNAEFFGVNGDYQIPRPFEDDALVSELDLAALGFVVTEDWK